MRKAKSRKINGYITTHNLGYGGGANMIAIGPGGTSSHSKSNQIMSVPSKDKLLKVQLPERKAGINPLLVYGAVGFGLYWMLKK